jgi:hypothetical protein
MKDKIVVELEKFNRTVLKLLKAKPKPMKSIKTTGKRPKGKMFPQRSGS